MEIMISVLTLTYKRHHLLEEAIQSFLSQDDLTDCEMVVINDNPEVDYIYDHPQVVIINHKTRFPSISAKLEWGYKQCKNDYIYRLDDDDLLMPYALRQTKGDILNHPGFDIYRSQGMYMFTNNKYDGIAGSVNNGNVYTKQYLDRITFPNTSSGEDSDITFGHNSKIYTTPIHYTMIYRWGMGTFHVSGLGTQTNEKILETADKILDDTKGDIVLHPHFVTDYYKQVKDEL